MAIRSYTNQALHDKVIEEAANQLDSVNHDIYVNIGNNRNAVIGDCVPDIVMTGKGSLDVQFIIEVETADSVNMTEARSQWRKFATEINASFYILVPFTHKIMAQTLCNQVGISARFGTYQVDQYGLISTIHYE